MLRLRSISLALAASAALAAPAAAQNVVYWTDSNLGTNVIPGAMSVLQSMMPGLTVTAASSQSEFNTLLASGGVDLAIFGEQGNSVFDGSSSVLATFLAGGGRVMGATWLPSNMPAFFDATRTSANYGTIAGGGQLFAGLASPISLANPGWGVYANGYATTETCLATSGNGDCAAVLGNGGQTLLLGPLFDAYASEEDGARFVANGAGLLLDASPTVTPEPATVALLGTGLLGMGAFGLRRRRAEG